MWTKNAWYAAAFSDEVLGKLLARRILDTPVVIYRRSDAAVVALEDRCAHRMLPLSFGHLDRRPRRSNRPTTSGRSFATSGRTTVR